MFSYNRSWVRKSGIEGQTVFGLQRFFIVEVSTFRHVGCSGRD